MYLSLEKRNWYDSRQDTIGARDILETMPRVPSRPPTNPFPGLGRLLALGIAGRNRILRYLPLRSSVHPLPKDERYGGQGHAKSEEDPKLRGQEQVTRSSCVEELHSKQSLGVSAFDEERLNVVSHTATKVVGRYNSVTIVMTRTVTDSLTVALLKARVFSFRLCAFCWCFRFKVSTSSCTLSRIFCRMSCAFWSYASVSLT